jgi:hypothetical protein
VEEVEDIMPLVLVYRVVQVVVQEIKEQVLLEVLVTRLQLVHLKETQVVLDHLIVYNLEVVVVELQQQVEQLLVQQEEQVEQDQI